MHPDQRPAIAPDQSLWRLLSEGYVDERDVDAHGRLRGSAHRGRSHAMDPPSPRPDQDLIARYEAAMWALNTSVASLGHEPASPLRRTLPQDAAEEAMRLMESRLEVRIAVLEDEIVLLRRALRAANVRVPTDLYE